MEKFIPYKKLSKKGKRKIDQAHRQTWGEFNPVTRKPENSKAYNRNKSRNWQRGYHGTDSGIFFMPFPPVATVLRGFGRGFLRRRGRRLPDYTCR